MSKLTQNFGDEMFNNIFELQFGYKPLTKKSNGGLLKFKDVSNESFKKLQLMGYIPYIVDEFENNPNPSFVNAVRVKGTAKETSCGSLRTIYKRIGFIDSKNGKMIKGKNYDKYFNWSDNELYCSELVWKIYKKAVKIELGKLKKISDLNLNKEVIDQLNIRYKGKVPYNELLITPAQIFNSDKLITIYNNN